MLPLIPFLAAIMLNVESYTLILPIFYRLLGFIYFCAFGPFIFQILGLIGKNGILPLTDFLESIEIRFRKRGYLYVPTLFWFNSSDKSLISLVVMGTVLSILLMCGVWPSILLGLLYILYLSIVSAGQDFLSFGWEGFLLEITFNAFLMSLTPLPNIAVWISMNLLLFRFHFQAGIVKIQSKDKAWKNLTALAYHYLTQPLPNTIAWYFHKLPLWFHKFSAILMFAIEIAVPFALFLSDDIRFGVFIAFIALQFSIWFTGNFSYLNHLTVVLCTIILSNKFLSPFLGQAPIYQASSLWIDLPLTLLGTFLIILQIIRLSHHFIPLGLMGKILYWLAPFHLANRYGIFAIMTVVRYEIVVEGSDDAVTWKEYLFKYKPSELTRRPRRISPYQPRLDWQAWFLPFSNYYNNGWFQKFLMHLLLGTPEVLKLIRHNPFKEKPPKYIRALGYDYEFSSSQEKKEKGIWWRRKYLGNYSPILSLKPGKQKS